MGPKTRAMREVVQAKACYNGIFRYFIFINVLIFSGVIALVFSLMT
jgi:hypothetical protein